jgi:molybdopterin-synthase adenylyltransferase
MDIIEIVRQDVNQIEQNMIQDIIPLPKDHRLNYRGCAHVAELIIEIDGKPTVITVGFPEFFPRDLPKFFDRANRFGPIPHKEKDGFICFTRKDSLIIDTRHPGSVLLNCLQKVIEVIKKGIRGENKLDYSLEFEAYWASQRELINLYGFIDTSNAQLRTLDLWRVPIGKNHLVIAAEHGHMVHTVAFQLFHVNLNEGANYRCIYFPLKEGTFIMPPQFYKTWDLSILKQNIFQNLSQENKTRFFQIIKRRSKIIHEREYIVIGLPLPDGHWALFGYQFTFRKATGKRNRKNKIMSSVHLHPLVMQPLDLNMSPVFVKRWHPHHLLNRTGGNTSLTDKHVVVVGTGSVGSEIAMRFAKAGIRQLTLVDDETLEMDNIHRHALGYDQVYWKYSDGIVNKYKVLGIKEEVTRRYPFTKVVAFNEKFDKVYQNERIDWSQVDLVVVAIGAPNEEMEINQLFHSRTYAPPVIYTWVEPLGIGGHALVTLNGVKEGCYQCLFKQSGEEPIFNRSAFAKPFQTFSKTITGCGSSFTPYSFLDSEKTAILAVEAGIRVLLRQMKDNPLLSWKGESSLFEQLNYESTPRYAFTVDKLHETRLLYKDSKCPVCTRGGDVSA